MAERREGGKFSNLKDIDIRFSIFLFILHYFSLRSFASESQCIIKMLALNKNYSVLYHATLKMLITNFAYKLDFSFSQGVFYFDVSVFFSR